MVSSGGGGIRNGFSADDLWVHDERDFYKAQILVRIFDDHLPRPFGVLYERACYETSCPCKLKRSRNEGQGRSRQTPPWQRDLDDRVGIPQDSAANFHLPSFGPPKVKPAMEIAGLCLPLKPQKKNLGAHYMTLPDKIAVDIRIVHHANILII
jgi:hypothetical protein